MSTIESTLQSAIAQLQALSKSMGQLPSTANNSAVTSAAANFAAELQKLLSGVGTTNTTTGTGTSGTTSSGTNTGTTGTTTGSTSSGSSTTTTGTGTTSNATSNWTPPWLAGSSSASQYLLPLNTVDPYAVTQAPSIAEFRKATGVDYPTAFSVIYEAPTGLKDLRDWDKIMSADNPLQAARLANRALYTSTESLAASNSFRPGNNELIAAAGNYAWIRSGDISRLWITDQTGTPISPVTPVASEVLRASVNRGLDIRQLNVLADRLDAAGESQAAAGLNLRELAIGGLGTPYDWRIDPFVDQKGRGAREQLEANIRLANEAGISSSRRVPATTVVQTSGSDRLLADLISRSAAQT